MAIRARSDPQWSSPLMDNGEQIGLVLACCTKYRIPEPTRQADIEVAKLKRRTPG